MPIGAEGQNRDIRVQREGPHTKDINHIKIIIQICEILILLEKYRVKLP